MGRYCRTIRYLRPRQLVCQLVHRIRWTDRRKAGLRVREPMPKVLWAPGVDFVSSPIGDARGQRTALSGTWVFQNRSESIGYPPDWNVEDLPMLWRYHLHYHDFLWDMEFVRARELVLHWAEHYRPGPRCVGWDPYPTSVRIANWCALFLGRYRAQTTADREFSGTLWASICEQAARLKRRLEWHLLGNHLFENGVALTLVGSCFEHPAAHSWHRTGIRILRRQLAEQILADGVHVERSPMYQSRVLYDLLMVKATGTAGLAEMVEPYRGPITASLKTMCHPDGRIALVNDSAFGVWGEPADLIGSDAQEDAGQVGPFALPDGGYYGSRTVKGHYIVCDAGAIGPDYQPGHGHADMLSFELSLCGHRVVVDSGVSTYDIGKMRAYCRSTRAHNTVEIEGRDQVELWSSFRVGRRCQPRDVEWKELPEGFELSARHDGYRHLTGRPMHGRTFRWENSGRLEIIDRVVSGVALRVKARLHFHPDCRISDLAGESCTVAFPGGSVQVSWSEWAQVAEDESFYCPEFGVAIPNPCLAFSREATDLRGMIRVALA